MGGNQSIGVNTRGQTLQDFETIRLLGKGAFGKVWLVKHIVSGEFYAMKILDKESVIKQDLIQHTILERDVMLMCNNPFIVNMYSSFQTITSLYFILDYIPGGSLWTYLCNHPDTCLSEKYAKFYAAEIVLGVECLHEKNIVYRDLKPENMLIAKDGHIVLTDFGLSHNLRSANEKVHSFSGTAIYIAPEVLLELGHDQVVDWWSFGVVLHLLLTGEPPFWSQNRKELFDLIKEGEIVINNPLLSENAKDIIIKLLNRDTSTRLGANGTDEVKNHPFFQEINWEDVMNKKLVPPFIPNFDTGTKAVKKEEDPTLLSQNGVSPRKSSRAEEDVFEGFDFTSSEKKVSRIKSPGKIDAKRIRIFNTKFQLARISPKKAPHLTNMPRSSSIDQELTTTTPTKSKRSSKIYRGHRRSRSQCAPISLENITEEPPPSNSKSKLPSLSRLPSVSKIIKK